MHHHNLEYYTTTCIIELIGLFPFLILIICFQLFSRNVNETLCMNVEGVSRKSVFFINYCFPSLLVLVKTHKDEM